MRSNLLKAGIAATFLTFSMVGASFAAPDEAGEGDNFTAESGPVKPAEPRIDAVLQQVQATVDGIKLDAQTRQLPQTEIGQLDSQASHIRAEAQRVAERHDGKVPTAQYHQLLAQLDKMNETVQGMSPSVGGGVNE